VGHALTFDADTPRACLDIETDAERRVTVVGLHRPDRGSRQWVRPRLDPQEMLEFLDGVEVLFTYNGGRFDLPVLLEQLGVDLIDRFRHRDLMHDCWKHGLFGGLKAVERRLGIHRDTDGVDGLEAVRLWDRHRRAGDNEALDLLLRYNREDVENLESLARKLGVVTAQRELPLGFPLGGNE
jgi:uncharacterized protein YprB with RNaseH-like and TPR domain